MNSRLPRMPHRAVQQLAFPSESRGRNQSVMNAASTNTPNSCVYICLASEGSRPFGEPPELAYLSLERL